MPISPVAQAILDDLNNRDVGWYTHDILTQTVPKILAIAPYLNEEERVAIRHAADHDLEAYILIDLALTAHRKHR